MNIKKIGVVVLLLLAMVCANPKTGRPDRNIFKELNLTAEQTKQLEANRKTVNKEMQANRKDLAEAHKRLHNELFKAELNETDIAMSRQRVLELESRQLDSMIDNTKNLRKVLTKEQLTTLKKQQEKGFKKVRKDFPKEHKNNAGSSSL